MRFSHAADCHIGGHRNPKLRALTEQAFKRFIQESIAANVDFIVIAGDLFNTALPGISTIQFTVQQLKQCKDRNIPVYAIPGSHDYSPSGKTMLAVLEEAGLLVNVFKGTISEKTLTLEWTTDKTGVKLTGIPGLRGMLDTKLYENITLTPETQSIFLFHTAITELTDIPGSQSIEKLPAGCTYYAGGHVHIVQEAVKQDKHLAYPGPLFPNSFTELEELKHGGYYLYEDGTLTHKKIELKRIIPLTLTLPAQLPQQDVSDAIVLLRIQGEGHVDIRPLLLELEQRGAYAILCNTSNVHTTTFTPTEIEEAHDIEAALLEEHKEQLQLQGRNGQALAKTLLTVLAREQQDGEKVYEYKEAVVKEALNAMDE
ncbi:MAG: exonuclease SbcCD subunit D [Candidatus Woesearchaeota archaeon]|nr:exonuclease SbcCD subunit D [Candidatus Woesearchaeota archaeon]